MSTRATVALGVWVLLMVLVGTMTVGVTAAFYLGMVVVLALIVAVLMVLTRRRGPDPDA